jgi:hypothetical protein
VEGLALDVRASTVASLSTKSFTNMRRLKLLQINGAHLAGSYKLLPNELIWLCWLECPMKSLPSDLQLNNLVVLDLQHSNIEELWKGTKVRNFQLAPKFSIMKFNLELHFHMTNFLSFC